MISNGFNIFQEGKKSLDIKENLAVKQIYWQSFNKDRRSNLKLLMKQKISLSKISWPNDVMGEKHTQSIQISSKHKQILRHPEAT